MRRDEAWDAIIPIAAGALVAACAATVDVPPPAPIEVLGGAEPILAGEPAPLDQDFGDTGGAPEHDPRVVVVQDAGGHRVIEKVFFEPNSARIPANAHALLEQVAEVMAQNPQVVLVAVDGHSDGRESQDTAARISRKRAKAVRDFLVAKGVAPHRLIVHAFGFDKPVDDNRTAKGRAHNRRVDFRVLKQN